MEILFVSNAASIHTVRWVNELAQQGHNVELAYCNNHGPKEDGIDERVKLHKLPFDAGVGYYLNARVLGKLFKKVKPDIVNAHYASGYGTLARMAKVKPLILSVWGSDVYDFPYKNSFNMFVMKKNLANADKVASTSYAMALQTSRLIDIKVSDIAITPFGVDINKFIKKNDNKTNGKIVIGTIKTLLPIYGIKDSIVAINCLINEISYSSKNNVEIEYRIYGEGSEKTELENLVSEYKLDSIVKFEGQIPNHLVPNILSECDIFLGTSLQESFGVAAVEAMSCEVPVVVTDVDGYKEVVEDGITGIIVKRKSPEEIAKALLELINDEIKRKMMGINGRKHVEKLYNFSDNVRYMVEVYEGVSQEYKKRRNDGV